MYARDRTVRSTDRKITSTIWRTRERINKTGKIVVLQECTHLTCACKMQARPCHMTSGSGYAPTGMCQCVKLKVERSTLINVCGFRVPAAPPFLSRSLPRQKHAWGRVVMIGEGQKNAKQKVGGELGVEPRTSCIIVYLNHEDFKFTRSKNHTPRPHARFGIHILI